MNKELITLKVAGTKFHEGINEVQLMSDGDELSMVPEPTNIYDKYAVKVLYNDLMLGYIPKIVSQVFSTLVQNGVHLEASITKVNPNAPPHEMVTFTISLV